MAVAVVFAVCAFGVSALSHDTLREAVVYLLGLGVALSGSYLINNIHDDGPRERDDQN